MKGRPWQVGFFKGYCTLDDAFAFLTEAKGLPLVARTSVRLRRLLRATVMLSWIALEDGLDDAMDDWRKAGREFIGIPTGLKSRLCFVLSALGASPLNEPEFDRLRNIRNCLAHPKAARVDDELSLEIANQTFELCIATLRALSPFRIVCPADQSDASLNHELTVRVHEAPLPNKTVAPRKTMHKS